MKELLKEKYNKTKKFIKEHKTEIVVGSIAIVGSIMGVKLLKDGIERYEESQVRNDKERLYIDAYNRATDFTNDVLIPELNNKWNDVDFSNYETDSEHARLYDEYNREYETKWNEVLQNELDKVGL